MTARIFDASFVLEGAARLAGTDDLGDPLYRPALEALIQAMDQEAGLEAPGFQRAATTFMSFLAIRAKVHAVLRAHPEIRDVPVPPPIFVVGLPRTGTTMLFNLLTRHPGLWSPPLWQQRSPVRPAAGHVAWEAEAVRETDAFLSKRDERVPEIRVMHPMNPYWPDECNRLLRYNFATLAYAVHYRVPSYVQWMTSTKMDTYYQAYREMLQILLWQRGHAARLVLKDPFHLWHIEPLLTAFPDAHVVFAHRRTDAALPSMASLCFALQREDSMHKDPSSMAPYILDLAKRGLFPMLEARRNLDPRRFTDVTYARLIADPRGTVGAICRAVGARDDDDTLAAAFRWLDENQQHKAGRHEYTLEQFGFSRSDLLDRFACYHDEFLPGEVR